MKTRRVIDQMQRTVEIPSTVLRIVSLVPSQTELLVDLGLADRLVGVTKFCIHPAHLKSQVTQVGGTKKVNIEKVRSLNPDLIIGNKEENAFSDIQELEKIAPVWMSDIFNLKDALSMISAIGELSGTTERAQEIASLIENGFARLKNRYVHLNASVLYLIWRKPFMAAGPQTFIDWTLEHLGFKNFMEQPRYPELGKQVEQPDYVWLSSEPYPFKQEHLSELQVMFPKAQIMLVDGEAFSWYGTRLIHSIAYFETFMELQD